MQSENKGLQKKQGYPKTGRRHLQGLRPTSRQQACAHRASGSPSQIPPATEVLVSEEDLDSSPLDLKRGKYTSEGTMRIFSLLEIVCVNLHFYMTPPPDSTLFLSDKKNCGSFSLGMNNSHTKKMSLKASPPEDSDRPRKRAFFTNTFDRESLRAPNLCFSQSNQAYLGPPSLRTAPNSGLEVKPFFV